MFIRKYFLTYLFITWDATQNYYDRASSLQDGMGKRMPRQEKTIKGRNAKPLILLPIKTTLLVKKVTSKEQESNTLDFHLDIISKIDKILADHDQRTPAAEMSPAPPLNPPSPPTPIEPRPPLNKTFPHEEIAWQPVAEPPRTSTPVIPGEFKTELSFNPEFRFITSREFTSTITQIPSADDRVEIIDCNTLLNDDAAYHEPINITPLKNEKDTSSFKQVLFDETHRHKKIEIIDMQTMKQKKYDHVLSASEEQTEQIDQKAQLYFLNSKETADKKQRKLNDEQANAPGDLEEQSRDLKKKLAEEEKKLRQLEQEYERLEKMEKKTTAILEKKQPPREKATTKKEQQEPRSKREIKKQQKEQKRLKRLQIRQARLEERRRKKLEKEALKLKQKQQHLKMKGTQQQKTSKENHSKEDKHPPVLLFDDDLIKVLHMTDSLLGELPDDILNDFIESKDYKLYEKVMNKYKIK